MLIIIKANAVEINTFPLNYAPVTRESLNKQNIYAIDISEIEPEATYQLIIDNTEYQFIVPKADTNRIRLYVMLSEQLDGHKLHLKDKNGGEVLLKKNEIETVINYKDHLFVNVYDDLITQIILEPIQGSKKTDKNNIFSVDYLLKIQVDLNGNLYWLTPSGKDWGWVYDYVYFNINSSQLSNSLLSNLMNGQELYSFIRVESNKNGQKYRLYTQAMQDIQLTAHIDSYSPRRKLKIVASKKSEKVSFHSSSHINNRKNKQRTNDTKYIIPIYLKVDSLCQYSNELLNAKLNLEYEIYEGVAFNFNEILPDSNILDQKLELFTTALPFGEKLKIGELKISSPVKNWHHMMDIKINFLKDGRLDVRTLNIADRQIDMPELKAVINDSEHDFDIKDLHCHIYDKNLQASIYCQCL